MKIDLIQLNFGGAGYMAFSEQINQMYCRQMGYGYDNGSSDLEPERHPFWKKVSYVLSYMRNTAADYILYMDMDAYIQDPSKRIEYVIREHCDPTTELLFSANRFDKNQGWAMDDHAQAGTFIIRNTPLALRIMEEWWNVPYYDKQHVHGWPVDQGALNKHIRTRWTKQIKIVDYSVINGYDGRFIRHLMGRSDDEREQILKGVCKERGILV